LGAGFFAAGFFAAGLDALAGAFVGAAFFVARRTGFASGSAAAVAADTAALDFSISRDAARRCWGE
jgi:hypothetical protein